LGDWAEYKTIPLAFSSTGSDTWSKDSVAEVGFLQVNRYLIGVAAAAAILWQRFIGGLLQAAKAINFA